MKRKTKQSKKIKMAGKWRESGKKWELVPWLTLSGKWLGESGF
jgi:hypothetical protein